MMARRHRLRRLQMGKSGHDPVGMCLGLIDQRSLQGGKRRIRHIDRVAHPQAEIGRHLVVARPRCVKPAGRVADHIGQPRLDIHVNIFEFGLEIEIPALNFVPDRGQTATNRSHVRAGQNARIAQHPGVRNRSGDILGIERLVKADGSVNSFHKRIGRCGEPSTPHPVGPAVRVLHIVEVLFIAHGSVQFHIRD